MLECDSKLLPLLSAHDLKLACAQCCVKEREITYSLKSLGHKCAHDVLLCKAKGGSKWRPVSRRPSFPNPDIYVTCWFFKEGFGCTQHKNRCTFARSDEEAAVWTFVKHNRLDHAHLCYLIAQSEKRPKQPNSAEPLSFLLSVLDLKVVCDLCSVRERDITYSVQSIVHKCGRTLLLAKCKSSDQWRPVSERPKGGHIGPNVQYKTCDYFVEGFGCSKHLERRGCTYARSNEEAIVWNHLRETNIDKDKLILLVTGSEPVSVTPEHAAECILQEFAGEFIELCKNCFQERPQKITTKRWNASCAADAAHPWNPVLVHHLSENSRKHIYRHVRPLPTDGQLTYCSHVREGKPCYHKIASCQSAQSEVEMAVWRAEQSGVPLRPHLLQLSQHDQMKPRQVSMYCKVCFLTLSSPDSFYKHCASLEHAQLVAEDTTTKWRCRHPPHNRQAEFWLCERQQTCEYGSNCPRAHSVEELQEWLMRATEEKEIRDNIESQGLLCYNEKLLEEYRNSSNEVFIISEHVDDVSISCDEELTVDCEEASTVLKWNFQVETERELVHVALLKQEPGALFTLGETASAPCLYSSGKQFPNEGMTYDISVSFTSINPGLYEQWLVLDFDMRPVLLRKLRVRVGQLPLDDTEHPTENHRPRCQSSERWHRGNRVIIPCSSRSEEQDELLKMYKPPQMSFLYKPNNSQTPLANDNYKERMHQFLYDEERAEDQVVSRLNVCGEITTLDTIRTWFDTEESPYGQLFCAMQIPYNLTPDSPEGLALKRSIKTTLIAPLNSDHPKRKVYEANILPHKTSENLMHLQLSKQCCSDLALKSNESYQMEVQFQLNRLNLCAMHKAVDLLPDMARVLPDLRKCEVPISDVICENLNTKQRSAVSFITGNCNYNNTKPVAPLLIYGPFGTGKTFTLATAARELCKNPHNKVLICTYTNSSADLYVREHFHPVIIEKRKEDDIRLIRIKANNQGIALNATDDITLKYCLLSEDGNYFLPPTKAAVYRHNVIITTTSMARHFHNLELAKGYFTHILIDEASQMLECEALMALSLAGPNTRIVLAGDHMQMGPKLFSVDDHNRSNHTLLTRLFHYYQGQNCEAARQSRIIFSENYRSTKEIVEFVSTHFYVGKNDVIRPTGDIPAPANGHALKFHHIRGECLFDTMSMSWYNKQEVNEAVKAVNDILKNWPSAWGHRDDRSICILSDRFQVRQIRRALERSGLDQVRVTTLANVQGNQFRAVILTAVQTRDSLKTAHLSGLELFNDARVLNTAMTRAQSLVVVVGDAAALCCFGKSSRIWRSFIDHCISNNSVSPKHFTKEFFDKDAMETARFQKFEHVDENNTLSDAILQELKDDYEKLKNDYSSDEDSSGFEDSNHIKSRVAFNNKDDIFVQNDLLELCSKQPELYKQGEFVRESYNRGYVMTFQHSTRKPIGHILIKGRANLGQAFTGDEVVLKTGNQGEMAKVLGITKKDESTRELICFLEDEDYSKPKKLSQNGFIKRIMTPITIHAPKICICIKKNRQNFIPVWEQIDGYWTIAGFKHQNEIRNHVFVVKVIVWKKDCWYPLGNVIDILPKEGPLDDLWLLKQEFNILSSTRESDDDDDDDDDDEGGGEEKKKRIEEEETRRIDEQTAFTFTVDKPGAKDLDDAISVRDCEDHYELGIHITDVASFVILGCDVDEQAKECGVAYYCRGKKTKDMFPEGFSTKRFSLLPGKKRKVISLIFKVQKEANKIMGYPTFQLSWIKSNRKLSYDEAGEYISERYKENPTFDEEGCVTLAYCFAKAQRKKRIEDWAYFQSDKYRPPGKRKAHLMIEELSILFNYYTSNTLIRFKNTMYFTPLRCQEGPDPVKIEDFREKYGDLIPLSFYLRHRVDHDEQTQRNGNFCILTAIWNDIVSAAKADDIDKMLDLIAADDIHPLLQPVIHQFRECSKKSYFIRSKPCQNAEIRHYSLNLPSYTQASSPMRRYMDIILQRLLHCSIGDREVQYSKSEIDALCVHCENKCKNAEEFEQRAEQIFYAVSMKNQSASKLAVVICADPNEDKFTVSFPFNKNLFARSLWIMYRDLQLDDQPSSGEISHSIILKWKKRIYTADVMQTQPELKMLPDSPCIEMPMDEWRAILEAVDSEKYEHAKVLIENANIEQLKQESPKQAPDANPNHLIDIDLSLQPGDTLKVQITSKEVRRAYNMPAVQLVHINPNFEICVDHIQSPIMSFSRTADTPTQWEYRNTGQYIDIWKPLCDMESTSTAVDESDSIIIENLEVTFKQELEGVLTGSFFLRPEWISEWAIEFNLAKCLLCIRKRGLKLTPNQEHSTVADPREYTWVAHGVTSKAKPKYEGKMVDFFVSHLPMENIPDCIFQQKACYTVEMYPKLLPDIRKEDAVINLSKACDLVQRIALGQKILKNVVPAPVLRAQIRRIELAEELPSLNESQCHAVETALHQSFTLIQGPPGTGKTVVGVYLVCWFKEMNSQIPMKYDNPEDRDKKEVILYCGPSNKSVDVVAEYLMKFKDKLKPLRVYSKQVEVLDYPYPDWNLQFSPRILRQDRAKLELRDITLHHRMREYPNPYADDIKRFDQLIRCKDGLTANEAKIYKDLLKKAQQYELEQHDIILCTCTQSSTPCLTKTVNARQILIDECAMATEPQSLIPLVCNKPEKIVLIGDHKQLRPIVKNERMRKLGMAKSLFERYYTAKKTKAVMLNTQYRMHEDICEFPSKEFYEGKLETEVNWPNSVLRVGDKTMPIVFGHIRGKTICQVVKTSKGNTNSKVNREERDKVIEIATKLVKEAKIEQRNIAILSPYNAQVSEIRDELKKTDLSEIHVTTITKSQGSEWRYVIISTVCSLPSKEIEQEPDGGWFSKHLGFVGDSNQINVAITRAKEGLCIIGNQKLLRCNKTWKRLLEHYTRKNAVTKAKNISVQCPRR
ncbi:3'-5' exoribonuclease HELZ2-like [Pholidichthys leucotaenia]